MSDRPGRLGVGIIGAGRVGAVLGSALRAADHSVVGVSATSERSQERAAELLPGVPVLGVEEVIERSELVLLAVPDDVLGDLVHGLATLKAFRPGQLIAHTAGRYGIDVLEPAIALGAIGLAIHPAMTFTGTSIDLTRLVGAPFAVTASGPVLPIAQALVVEIGGEPVVLAERDRGRYHAAMAHGANHLVTLTAQATRILRAAGIEDGGALLRPIMSAALDGALRGGDGAITGPVSRGDAGTVAEHLQTLAGVDAESTDGDVLATYRALARATAQRALTTGRIRTEQAQAILDVLDRSPRTAQPTSADTAVVLSTLEELRSYRDAIGEQETVATVLTLGALHDGHLRLIETAAQHADHVIVTIFVNPLQFDRPEDLRAYPRALESDLEKLTGAAATAVFAPGADQIYPEGEPQVSLRAGRLGEIFEGASRPGHFDGVLTVVHKLFALTRPDLSVFGRKDAQQLALIRQMVRDLNMPVQIVAADTVREPDGLALSSRNSRLSAAERDAALALVMSLRAAERAAAQGQGPQRALTAARDVLDAADPALVSVDYLELVDPDTFAEYTGGPGLLLVAAEVAGVRLIDNATIAFEGEPEADVSA